MLAVCLIAPCTPVNDTVEGVAFRIGSVVTRRTTEMVLLSGANEEPASVMVALESPVAIPLPAVTSHFIRNIEREDSDAIHRDREPRTRQRHGRRHLRSRNKILRDGSSGRHVEYQIVRHRSPPSPSPTRIAEHSLRPDSAMVTDPGVSSAANAAVCSAIEIGMQGLSKSRSYFFRWSAPATPPTTSP